MRDILERVAAGELSPDEAEARLKGYVPNEAGRFDATRERRSGVPEAIFGVGKTPSEVTQLAVTSLETTGRVIATRIERETRETVRDRLEDADPTVETRVDERANLLVAHAETYDPPALAATVGVVTAGTADILPAREATAVAEEMGADVSRTEDVGVAGPDCSTSSSDSASTMFSSSRRVERVRFRRSSPDSSTSRSSGCRSHRATATAETVRPRSRDSCSPVPRSLSST